MKTIKILILIPALGLLGGGVYWWWQHEKAYPSTNDAYLHANLLTVSPQVGGRVTKLAVSENDYVKEGALLVQLDTVALEAATQTAQARYDLALQAAGASTANVHEAEGRLASAHAVLVEARARYDRTRKLFEEGDVTQAALDQVTSARDTAQAGVEQARAAVAAARDQLGATGSENAAVRAALGELTQARINLEHARITAPAGGWVSNITLRPGQVVSPGEALFALIEDGNWWVDANFKETDLSRIRPGQPVTLGIDMYPGTTLHGTIESIGAGSGAVFSLLPPQNATGNWVKVTQRFPVRIALSDKLDNAGLRLRVGASVTATVDTTGMQDK